MLTGHDVHYLGAERLLGKVLKHEKRLSFRDIAVITGFCELTQKLEDLKVWGSISLGSTPKGWGNMFLASAQSARLTVGVGQRLNDQYACLAVEDALVQWAIHHYLPRDHSSPWSVHVSHTISSAAILIAQLDTRGGLRLKVHISSGSASTLTASLPPRGLYTRRTTPRKRLSHLIAHYCCDGGQHRVSHDTG